MNSRLHEKPEYSPVLAQNKRLCKPGVRATPSLEPFPGWAIPDVTRGLSRVAGLEAPFETLARAPDLLVCMFTHPFQGVV